MQRVCVLRGHLNPISTIQNLKNNVISTDDHGWLVIWSLSTHEPLYCWKAHDKTVLTTIVIDDEHILTHSKDSEIKIWNVLPQETAKLSSQLPSFEYNDLTYLKDDCTALLNKYPIPHYDFIPVNSLNYCNIDFRDGLLVTPATVNSDNFDVYQIDHENFSIKRILHDISAFDIYKKHKGYIEEVNSGKRDGFGILMNIVFTDNHKFFIGFESGHVAGFEIIFNQVKLTIKTDKYSLLQSVINRDPSIKLIYYNEFHVPNPILCLERLHGKLIVGSTGKRITIHDISDPEKEVKEINLKKNGVQSIQVVNNLTIVGFWGGIIKMYDEDFTVIDKQVIELPKLNNVETNHNQTDEAVETKLKLSILKVLYYNPPEQTNSKSKYKSLVTRKKFNKYLVLAGYNDGKIVVFEVVHTKS